MHKFYSGQFFNFEAVRILGTVRYGGADVAEFLEAVGEIRENDAGSWHAAWARQAERAEALAEQAQHDGHRAAARSAFLRAANYARASSYMMTGSELGSSDPRVAPILRTSAALFTRALALFNTPVHTLHIPYKENGVSLSLPAYLYLPAPRTQQTASTEEGKARGQTTTTTTTTTTPVVISLIGADSTQEEIYHMLPAAGPELGYAVLTFEGPGQGLTLHEHGAAMRADWGAVTGAALDALAEHAHTHPDLSLDMGRVAVAGASLGAYFALRSAAADARLAACVAIDPMYDLWEFASRHVAPTFFGLWDRGWIPDWAVNAAVLQSTRLSFQSRWEIFTSARFLGADSPVGILRAMKQFTLRRDAGTQGQGEKKAGSYLEHVVCPTLVTGAADSLYFDVDEHTAAVFDRLGAADKELWVGASPGQGSLQAKMGALGLCNQRVFAFLDRHLGVQREALS
ncbi:dipeptidyl aminopeptidase/acylaminoacyl peptidase [Lasiosphaeria ovina]|uniref:Dipeptidyl aminopeptidase/acylaminoacyl peptidase n=1 Tax=Lasiosphaeria ovina TaxID=92902 RepID=A0AAE0KG45_9PEZI|nr:dipeptidyl aminopeptidase/acylaminoacyl peptidase [Lasiosphaeria ovina]